MREEERAARIIDHLMAEANELYGAEEFTLLTEPRHGTIWLRFKVAHDVNAKRPTAPPETVRPDRWDEMWAECIEDHFGEMHMTWKWPAGPQHHADAWERSGKEAAARRGLTIEIR